MALERRQKTNGTWQSILVKCPACGYPLTHRGGCQLRQHLLEEHTPEDFGLTPLAD